MEITSPADQENRRLTTLRKGAGVARTRLINQVKWVLRRHNLQWGLPTKTFPTDNAVAWLTGLALPGVDRLEVDHLLAGLEQADRRQRDPEQAIARRSAGDQHVVVLSSMPGVGRGFTALSLAGRVATTGKAGPRFDPPKGRVARLAFVPDGATLAACGGRAWGDNSEPGWVELWDLKTGTVRRAISDPTGMAAALAFTPDGRSLVTGGLDGVIRVWELATGQGRRAFKGHGAAVYTLAVSADGRHVASASSDVPTLVWDLYAPAGGPPTEVDARRVLADLGGDPAVAFAAVRRLASHPAEAVPLLRANLKPAPATDPTRIAALVRALDADRFGARERTAAELARLGDEAEAALRAALAGTPTPEARERLTHLLPKVAALAPDRLRELRAVEALEAAGTPEAAALLAEWARDPGLRVSRDAAAAAGRVAARK